MNNVEFNAPMWKPIRRSIFRPTEQEVRAAVEKFVDGGGVIKTLPLEPTPIIIPLVGWKYAEFEQISILGGRYYERTDAGNT